LTLDTQVEVLERDRREDQLRFKGIENKLSQAQGETEVLKLELAHAQSLARSPAPSTPAPAVAAGGDGGARVDALEAKVVAVRAAAEVTANKVGWRKAVEPGLNPG